MGDDTTRSNSRAGSPRALIWLNSYPFRTSEETVLRCLSKFLLRPLYDRCWPFGSQPLCPCAEASLSPDLSGTREWPLSEKFVSDLTGRNWPIPALQGPMT